MTDWSTNLKLPYMAAAQAQKHVTHNEALERLDAIVQLTLKAFDASTPPLTPVEGDIWAIGLGAVNEWAGHDSELAAWSNGGWLFLTPLAGWRAAMGSDVRVWTGAAWVAPDLPELQNLPGVGIGASYDANTPLAVAGPASLFTHSGTDHRLQVNKALVGNTASLLFQTNWSGRAEMGTTGSDDFAVKVSPNGTAWQTAFSALAASGRVRFGAATEVTPGTATAPGVCFVGDTNTGIYQDAADTLGFAIGGAQRARLTSAGLNVSGTISGTAVQSSATDTTTGRLLSVGGFGLGSGDLPESLNPDTIVTTGFYRVTASAAMPATGAFALQHLQRDTGEAVQTSWLLAAPQRQFIRHFAEAAWTAWRVFNETLGTVSQSGGAATGAIIERGTNANGEYVRFADGTQLCFSRLTGVAITSLQSYGLYRSAAVTWTFPAAFVLGALNGATVQGRMSDSNGFSVHASGGALTTGATDIRAYATASVVSTDLYLHAAGRWI